VNDAELLAYSDGSYSTSDWGCVGDTIALSPRPFPVPGFLKVYTSWARALQEATETCALQMGPCWVLSPSQIGVRCGQREYGGCPTCRGPDAPSSAGSLQGLSRQNVGPQRTFPDAVRREVEANWRPVAVVTPNGMSKVLPDGCVLPLWDRKFNVTPPDRLVRERSGLTYRAAVAAAQEISQRTQQLRVVNGEVPSRHPNRKDKTIPVVYVEPGGIVRAAPQPRGWETNVYRMDPLEVREAFMLSRGGSLMPHGM
jgi:hypothetical protein